MCKACKMDPTEVERFRVRQGALDPDDFEEECNYRVKKKNKPKRVRGCPGNDNKAHIYVWTTEVGYVDEIFKDYFGYYPTEYNICAGCFQRKPSKSSRRTAKYAEERAKRFKTFKKSRPRARIEYFNWECYDDEYVAYKNKRGYPAYLWRV